MQGLKGQCPFLCLWTANDMLQSLLFLFRSSTNSVTRWLWKAWTPSERTKGEEEGKTSKAIFSSPPEWHLITNSSFRLSSELLWWEQGTKVQPFTVKYCINKTKHNLPFLSSSVNVQHQSVYPGPWSDLVQFFSFLAIRLECYPSM